MHFDGSFVDNSLLNNSLTPVGTPLTTAVNPKWGTECYLGATLSGLRKTTGLSPFAFASSEDFTIECWAYTQTGILNGAIITGRAATTPSTSYLLYAGGTTVNWLQNNSINLLTGTAPNNQWNHIAVCRASGTTRLFVNGIIQATATFDTRTYACNELNVGVDGSGTSNSTAFTGRMDDLRVTKGIGLYTANFTPPTAAFPNP